MEAREPRQASEAGVREAPIHEIVGDFFARRDPERTSRRLVAQLERLGYNVTLQEAASGANGDFSSAAAFFAKESGTR